MGAQEDEHVGEKLNVSATGYHSMLMMNLSFLRIDNVGEAESRSEIKEANALAIMRS